MIKHDEKKIEELYKKYAVEYFTNKKNIPITILGFIKQYAEHMVQQERDRIQKIGEDILDTEMEYYGTDKHGLSREQFIKAINQE